MGNNKPGRPKMPESEKLKMFSVRINPVFNIFYKAWSKNQADTQRVHVEEGLALLIEKRAKEEADERKL